MNRSLLGIKLLVGLLVSLPGLAWAQAEPAALRDLLNGGYYALAAQVEGPRAVNAAPQSSEAHLLYARALYLVGNLENAQTQVKKAETLARTPQQRRSAVHLDALVKAAQGDATSATKLLESVFGAAPSYRVAMDWGQVAWQGGNLKAALRAYRAAAATLEGKAEPWPTLNVARVMLQQGRYQNALAPLETTLDRLEGDPSPRPSPAYAETFYRLGQAHEALGSVQEAVSNYSAARSADPDYTPATDALARLGAP